jgi:hypothetical protein
MSDLTIQIRKSIAEGRLPRIDCLVTWLGPGRGQVCAVCSGRILGSELSVECDLPDKRTLWFHSRCYDEWLSVRRSLD